MRGELTIARLLRMRERHLDHFDAEQRRCSDPCRASRRSSRPARSASARPPSPRRRCRCSRRSLRVGDERVRVRAAARLHDRRSCCGFAMSVMSKMRMPRARIRAHRVRHALHAAVDAPARAPRPRRRAGSGTRTTSLCEPGQTYAVCSVGRRGFGDVPHLIAAVVALEDVVAREREVGVLQAVVARRAAVDEARRRRGARDEPQVPARLARHRTSRRAARRAGRGSGGVVDIARPTPRGRGRARAGDAAGARRERDDGERTRARGRDHGCRRARVDSDARHGATLWIGGGAAARTRVTGTASRHGGEHLRMRSISVV